MQGRRGRATRARSRGERWPSPPPNGDRPSSQLVFGEDADDLRGRIQEIRDQDNAELSAGHSSMDRVVGKTQLGSDDSGGVKIDIPAEPEEVKQPAKGREIERQRGTLKKSSVLKDLRGTLSTQGERHEMACEYFEFLYYLFFFPTVVLAALVPVIESFADAESISRKPLILTVGTINTILITFGNMKGYQGLKERHSDATQQYAKLKHRLDNEIVKARYKHSGDSEERINDLLGDMGSQITELAGRCPPVPLHIQKAIEHGRPWHSGWVPSCCTRRRRSFKREDTE